MTVTSGLTCAGANISGNLVVGGTTTLAGVSITNISATNFSTDNADVDYDLTVGGTIVGQGNISTVAGQFIGNGAGLTGVTDAGALPKAGGTMTGALTVSSGNITATTGQFVGNGAGLTGITSTDPNALPKAGGTMTGALTVSAGNITATTGQFVGNGAGLTGITSTDVTKLPLAGGSMTGSITSQYISVLPGYTIFNYKGNKFSIFQNTTAGQSFTVVSQNSSVHDYIKLLNNSSCTVSLVNLVTTDNQHYQDQQRLATITKRNMHNADYAVTVLPPLNYLFNSKDAINAASYSIPLGVFSVTFMINSVSSQAAYEIDVISTVNV
jgi:hypothetical protein